MSIMKTRLLLILLLVFRAVVAQPPEGQRDFRPLVAIQNEDYIEARRHFQPNLLRPGPAPQKWTQLSPPTGVKEIEYPSGPLKLKAWLNSPATNDKKHPAVLFLHGGQAFSMGDWEMAQPYRDAGFVLMAPILRAENGQPGNYSMYYDEIDDVIAAGEFLRTLPYVDSTHV